MKMGLAMGCIRLLARYPQDMYLICSSKMTKQRKSDLTDHATLTLLLHVKIDLMVLNTADSVYCVPLKHTSMALMCKWARDRHNIPDRPVEFMHCMTIS